MTDGRPLYDDLARWVREYPPAPIREIHGGRGLLAHLREWVDTRAPAQPGPLSGSLAGLTGIPIYVDEELADNQLQVRDDDGTVLTEVWF